MDIIGSCSACKGYLTQFDAIWFILKQQQQKLPLLLSLLLLQFLPIIFTHLNTMSTLNTVCFTNMHLSTSVNICCKMHYSYQNSSHFTQNYYCCRNYNTCSHWQDYSSANNLKQITENLAFVLQFVTHFTDM